MTWCILGGGRGGLVNAIFVGLRLAARKIYVRIMGRACARQLLLCNGVFHFTNVIHAVLFPSVVVYVSSFSVFINTFWAFRSSGTTFVSHSPSLQPCFLLFGTFRRAKLLLPFRIHETLLIIESQLHYLCTLELSWGAKVIILHMYVRDTAWDI